ncbi:hypothetical protein NEMBOFW57_009422 [Staphylotrichum longicolle]|uniref:Uncharacterized protein n=1 Tax=Staphylotrichum longicolle TaxID=669026 RepID=A0AAD4HUS3_9PEZI|nr:hypothetical protein NEMBOFW57_009422 [Staphylotrichum longicolle]
MDFNFDELPCSFTMDSMDLALPLPAGHSLGPEPAIPSFDFAPSADSTHSSSTRIAPTQRNPSARIQKSTTPKKRAVRGPFKSMEERIETTPRLVHYPCLRKRLTDTSFVPEKSDPGLYWTRRWTSMHLTEIEDWASSEIKTIELTQTDSSIRWNVRSREERDLLRDVLKLWVVSRIQSRSERICGADTVGIGPQMQDVDRHDYGYVPLPPVISAQITIIAEVMFFRPLQSQIRKRLDKLIGAKNPGAWFTVYLVCMLLLHNCALITENYFRKARNLRLSQRYAAADAISDLHGSANILLTYYHCRVKGNVPFAAGWKSARDVQAAKLSKEQVEFLVWSNQQSRTMSKYHQNTFNYSFNSSFDTSVE